MSNIYDSYYIPIYTLQRECDFDIFQKDMIGSSSFRSINKINNLKSLELLEKKYSVDLN